MTKFKYVLVRLNKTASTYTCLCFLHELRKSWLPRKVQRRLIRLIAVPDWNVELPPCIAEDLCNLPYATQVFVFEWRGL